MRKLILTPDEVQYTPCLIHDTRLKQSACSLEYPSPCYFDRIRKLLLARSGMAGANAESDEVCSDPVLLMRLFWKLSRARPILLPSDLEAKTKTLCILVSKPAIYFVNDTHITYHWEHLLAFINAFNYCLLHITISSNKSFVAMLNYYTFYTDITLQCQMLTVTEIS